MRALLALVDDRRTGWSSHTRRFHATCRRRRYGYRGFYDRDDRPVVLTRRSVDGIQLQGGTILGTSRGGADIK